MKNKLNRPWLTATDVERPLDEIKEISKSWDEQTWNNYLNWFQSGNSEKLVSNNVFSKISEELEKNIFEEFGYQSRPELRSFCDQLLRSVPEIQQQILRSIFFDGKTQTHGSHFRVCKRAKVKEIRIHDLRHTFASHYIMNGGSLAELQSLLGHSSPMMTLKYAHLTPGFLEKKASVVSFSIPKQNVIPLRSVN